MMKPRARYGQAADTGVVPWTSGCSDYVIINIVKTYSLSEIQQREICIHIDNDRSERQRN